MKKSLDNQEYEEVVSRIENKQDLIEISKETKVLYDTLLCISSQIEQNKTRATHFSHRNVECMAKYYQIIRQKEFSIVELSSKVELSSSLMSRLILQYHVCLSFFGEQSKGRESSGALSKKESSEQSSQVLKEEFSERLSGQVGENSESGRGDWVIKLNNKQLNSRQVKEKVKEMMKDVRLIEDKELREQVSKAICEDKFYSPFVEKVKANEGVEYELLLQGKLKKFGIKFHKEQNLREMGLSKTPDIKLKLPIVINGQVINWIESKASFGDHYTHQQYLRSQFWGYFDRFGPGAVIYWFGFVKHLQTFTENENEKQILLLDNFPSDFGNDTNFCFS